MSFEDFIVSWRCTHICHVMFDSKVKTYKVEGEALDKPHVFNLFQEKNSKVSISVLHRHWRFNRNLKNKVHPTSMVIAKYNTNKGNFTQVDGQYNGINSLEFYKCLDKGLYAIWIYNEHEFADDPQPDP